MAVARQPGVDALISDAPAPSFCKAVERKARATRQRHVDQLRREPLAAAADELEQHGRFGVLPSSMR